MTMPKTTKFLRIIALALALVGGIAATTSAAFARNEVVNGIFREGHKIDPIQGDLGVANWVVTRPDNGETMYFEKCWDNDGGLSCLYEVLFKGRSEPSGDVADIGGACVLGQRDCPQGGSSVSFHSHPEWSGPFPESDQTDKGTLVSVTIDGETKHWTYGTCEAGDGPHGNGLYCLQSSLVE